MHFHIFISRPETPAVPWHALLLVNLEATRRRHHLPVCDLYGLDIRPPRHSRLQVRM